MIIFLLLFKSHTQTVVPGQGLVHYAVTLRKKKKIKNKKQHYCIIMNLEAN